VQLGYTRIVAPMSGRVGARLVDPGNIVHAADVTGLVVINQVDPVSVVFTLPEETFQDVNRALHQSERPLQVIAYPRDGTSALGSGRLTLVNNQIDTATGTVQLKGTFPNPGHALWPGQYVNVRLVLGHDPHALTVPAAAITLEPRLWLADDGKARSQPVRLTSIQDGLAVVAGGLQAGERVVIDGQYKLRPDVTVVEVARGARGAASAASAAGTGVASPLAQNNGGSGEPAMNISAAFIKRPIGTTLLALAILLCRQRGVSAAARRAAAAGRLPDHPREREPAGREPGDDGVERGAAARAPVLAHRRPHADDVAERHRQHADHAAVRARPLDRRGCARRAGGHQRLHRPAPEQPAEPADLPQGEPGRRTDHADHGAVEDAAADPGQRLGRQHPGAADLADLGGRPGQHRRGAKARRAHPGRPGPAGRARFEPGGHPRRHRDGFGEPARAPSTARASFTVYTTTSC
jgi:hypothetical protein